MWDVKGPTQLFEKSRGRRPRLSVANLYGLWDWVGMASCMGPFMPIPSGQACVQKSWENKIKHLIYTNVQLMVLLIH